MPALGVSRTPLREALKVLATRASSSCAPNRGSIVAPVDPVEIGHVFELKAASSGRSACSRRCGRPSRTARGWACARRAGLHRDPRQARRLYRAEPGIPSYLAGAAQNPLLLQT